MFFFNELNLQPSAVGSFFSQAWLWTEQPHQNPPNILVVYISRQKDTNRFGKIKRHVESGVPVNMLEGQCKLRDQTWSDCKFGFNYSTTSFYKFRWFGIFQAEAAVTSVVEAAHIYILRVWFACDGLQPIDSLPEQILLNCSEVSFGFSTLRASLWVYHLSLWVYLVY